MEPYGALPRKCLFICSSYLRPGQRVVVYPKLLDKLNGILSTGDIGLDPVQRRLPAYEAILTQSMTWPEGSRPIMLPEDRTHLSQWPILASKAGKWMEDAKQIAVAGYRQVVEVARTNVTQKAMLSTATTAKNGQTRRCTRST
jgi:hypothetical protein